MERRLLTLLAETPVHAGGPESLAAVDLPIQREAATGLPVIWGQSLKGALRQAWRDARLPGEEDLFGSRPPRTSANGAGEDTGGALTKGGIAVGDAQLLLFPAGTLRQVFGWVSSPLLLGRLSRKLRLLGAEPGEALTVTITGGYCLGAPEWAGQQVVGPFLVNVKSDAEPGRLGAVLADLVCPRHPEFTFTRQKMGADILLADDSTIGELARMGTDVVARVQLEEETKKAKNLFYSEHLPAETVLTALLTGPAGQLTRLDGLLDGKPLQLGGDETIGKGVLWCRLHSADSVRAGLGAAPATVAAEPATPPPPPVPVPVPVPVPAASSAKPTPGSIFPRKKPHA